MENRGAERYTAQNGVVGRLLEGTDCSGSVKQTRRRGWGTRDHGGEEDHRGSLDYDR